MFLPIFAGICGGQYQTNKPNKCNSYAKKEGQYLISMTDFYMFYDHLNCGAMSCLNRFKASVLWYPNPLPCNITILRWSGILIRTLIWHSDKVAYRTSSKFALRYHIIDLPGVLGNNVLGSFNCSYDLIRCIEPILASVGYMVESGSCHNLNMNTK